MAKSWLALVPNSPLFHWPMQPLLQEPGEKVARESEVRGTPSTKFPGGGVCRADHKLPSHPLPG